MRRLDDFMRDETIASDREFQKFERHGCAAIVERGFSASSAARESRCAPRRSYRSHKPYRSNRRNPPRDERAPENSPGAFVIFFLRLISAIFLLIVLAFVFLLLAVFAALAVPVRRHVGVLQRRGLALRGVSFPFF